MCLALGIECEQRYSPCLCSAYCVQGHGQGDPSVRRPSEELWETPRNSPLPLGECARSWSGVGCKSPLCPLPLQALHCGTVIVALLSLHQVLVTVRSTYFIETIVENVQFGADASSRKGDSHPRTGSRDASWECKIDNSTLWEGQFYNDKGKIDL